MGRLLATFKVECLLAYYSMWICELHTLILTWRKKVVEHHSGVLQQHYTPALAWQGLLIFTYPIEKVSHSSLFFFALKILVCNPITWTINDMQTSLCFTKAEEIQWELDRAMSDNNRTYIQEYCLRWKRLMDPGSRFVFVGFHFCSKGTIPKVFGEYVVFEAAH